MHARDQALRSISSGSQVIEHAPSRHRVPVEKLLRVKGTHKPRGLRPDDRVVVAGPFHIFDHILSCILAECRPQGILSTCVDERLPQDGPVRGYIVLERDGSSDGQVWRRGYLFAPHCILARTVCSNFGGPSVIWPGIFTIVFRSHMVRGAS
jgi:hypothetical protein